MGDLLPLGLSLARSRQHAAAASPRRARRASAESGRRAAILCICPWAVASRLHRSPVPPSQIPVRLQPPQRGLERASKRHQKDHPSPPRHRGRIILCPAAAALFSPSCPHLSPVPGIAMPLRCTPAHTHARTTTLRPSITPCFDPHGTSSASDTLSTTSHTCGACTRLSDRSHASPPTSPTPPAPDTHTYSPWE